MFVIKWALFFAMLHPWQHAGHHWHTGAPERLVCHSVHHRERCRVVRL